MSEARPVVLVVDDDDLVARVLAAMLDELGYESLVSYDGVDALDQLETVGQCFVAVLLDLSLPPIKGVSMTELIRERVPSLPIILCSGASRAAMAAAGGDGILAKPFHIDELESVLSDVQRGA